MEWRTGKKAVAVRSLPGQSLSNAGAKPPAQAASSGGAEPRRDRRGRPMVSTSRSQGQLFSSVKGSASLSSGHGSLPCLSPAPVSLATVPAYGMGGYLDLPDSLNPLHDAMPLSEKPTSSPESEAHLASPLDLTSMPSAFGLFELSEFATSPNSVPPRSHAPQLSHGGSSEPPAGQPFSPVQSSIVSRAPSLVADISPRIPSREQV